MLVLKRVTGQHIVIAGGIRITVLKIQGSQVKLGIAAPSDISILRGELHVSTRTSSDPLDDSCTLLQPGAAYHTR